MAYLKIPHNANMNVGEGDFSIDLWVKTTQSGERKMLLIKANPRQNANYVLALRNDGYARFDINDSGRNYRYSPRVGSKNPVNDGRWHYIVAQRINKNLQMYVDGEFQGEADGSFVGSVDVGYEMRLTNYNNGDYYEGLIDEVRVAKRALSEDEIRNRYETLK